MGLIRIGTPSTSMDVINAIILETDQVLIVFTRSAIAGRSAAELESAIASAAGVYPLPDIYAHINRDGSIALATGAEPSSWPEDE